MDYPPLLLIQMSKGVLSRLMLAKANTKMKMKMKSRTYMSNLRRRWDPLFPGYSFTHRQPVANNRKY